MLLYTYSFPKLGKNVCVNKILFHDKNINNTFLHGNFKICIRKSLFSLDAVFLVRPTFSPAWKWLVFFMMHLLRNIYLFFTKKKYFKIQLSIGKKLFKLRKNIATSTPSRITMRTDGILRFQYLRFVFHKNTNLVFIQKMSWVQKYGSRLSLDWWFFSGELKISFFCLQIAYSVWPVSIGSLAKKKKKTWHSSSQSVEETLFHYTCVQCLYESSLLAGYVTKARE